MVFALICQIVIIRSMQKRLQQNIAFCCSRFWLIYFYNFETNLFQGKNATKKTRAATKAKIIQA